MTETDSMGRDSMQFIRMFNDDPIKFCTWANKLPKKYRRDVYRQLRRCRLDTKFIRDYYYEEIIGKFCFLFGIISFPELERKKGEYYGYPKCCIDNFINLKFNGKTPGEYMMKHYGPDIMDGTGYIRCPKCRGKEVVK